MNVLVTGACGGLGSETVTRLVAAGYSVVATDVSARRALPLPVVEMNLLDLAGVASLMSGVEAVVHLGNHTGTHKRPQAMTFNENIAMDMNVFQGALEAGVRKIIFSSSVQVIATESREIHYPPHAKSVAYLPLDEQSPPNPANAYAISKLCGETVLKEYIAPHGVECWALRFPAIRTVAGFDRFGAYADDQEYAASRISQGFSVLSYGDSAAANVAALATPRPGYHVFLPAISQVTGAAVRRAIEKHYPGVRLTRPMEEIESLVDSSAFTRATGWTAKDLVR